LAPVAPSARVYRLNDSAQFLCHYCGIERPPLVATRYESLT
jgi:hypothetical protein